VELNVGRLYDLDKKRREILHNLEITEGEGLTPLYD